MAEYDSARIYLAKWARVVAEEGEKARRAEVIVRGPGGTLEDTEVGAFEVLSVSFPFCAPPARIFDSICLSRPTRLRGRNRREPLLNPLLLPSGQHGSMSVEN